MIIFDTIFEKSYLFNGLLSAAGGFLILCVLFFIVIRLLWKHIKQNALVIILFFVFFLFPSFPFILFFLTFCGFIPALIDGLIIVESPKQYIVEIVDKKIERLETTTETVTVRSNSRNRSSRSSRSNTRSTTYSSTKTITLSDTDININNLIPSTSQRPDGKKVKIDYSFKIYVKKWWKGSDQEPIAFSIPKNDYEKYKKDQKVYVKTKKGIFGMQHIVKDSDFLKLVKESDSKNEDNEKDMK